MIRAGKSSCSCTFGKCCFIRLRSLKALFATISLYVDKNWHGTGMASELMQRVVDWFDDTKPIELGVVAYNERAKAFYKKWGFEEIPNTETLFDNSRHSS